jgi:hypothetical protein
MSDKPLFTFHGIRERCEAGEATAWRAFLELYIPLFHRLLHIYSPHNTSPHDALAEDAIPQNALPQESLHRPLIEEFLRQLADNDFQRVRQSARQSEREFLVELRAVLLEIASAANTPETSGLGSEEEVTPTKVTPETVKALLDGLPLMHQEMVFMKLGGYTNATLEQILRIAPHVAGNAFERLQQDYATVLDSHQDRCPWSGDWLALLRHARGAKQEACHDLHLFLRVHDGQVSWYDKEPVEKHVAGCLYCLDRWTALREVGYWRRVAPPTPAATIDELLRVLPVVAKQPPKSLLRRVFG